MNKIILWLSVAAAALALVACGDSGTAAPAAATTTTITGSAVKGPVNGATVTIRNASTNAVLGTTTTTISGAYSITTTFVGDVLIEINGGSYIDEASGATTPLATPMRTVLTANGGSVVGMVTPLTTMAYTYSGSSTPTAAAFNTAAANLATQMGLPGINLVTSMPLVTGTTTNAYGNALRALSQYMLTNSVQLNTLINQAMNTSTYAAFNSAYSAAYTTATGQTITVSFNGSNLITIGGTGVGGGTGTCGVQASGSITFSGANFPVNINYCYQGIAAGSCTEGNSVLNSSVNSALAGGDLGVTFNVTYAYSSTCAPGAITLQLI